MGVVDVEDIVFVVVQESVADADELVLRLA